MIYKTVNKIDMVCKIDKTEARISGLGNPNYDIDAKNMW